MGTDEVELRRKTCQSAEHYEHQGATEDELQPRATHRRYERLANNIHFFLGEARLLTVSVRNLYV